MTLKRTGPVIVAPQNLVHLSSTMAVAFGASIPTARWTVRNGSFFCFSRHSNAFLTNSARRGRPASLHLNDSKISPFNSDGSADCTVRASFDFTDPAFAKAVSGEWFGYECTFSVPDGKPMNIPERFIPDEFRQWGIEIKGFDSLSSTRCLEDNSLFVKRTRALPSVGCEADAVVPDVLEQTFLDRDRGTINGGFSDGTFSCGPASLIDELSERCSIALVDPSEKNSRVRLEFSRVAEPPGSVTVFLENWDATFSSGGILPGCGGVHESFATDAVLQPSEALLGKWTVESVVYTFLAGDWTPQHFSSVVERTASITSEEVTIALPRGVSVGTTTDVDGAKTIVAAWLAKKDLRIVSRRKYEPTGELLSVSRSVETRQC